MQALQHGSKGSQVPAGLMSTTVSTCEHMRPFLVGSGDKHEKRKEWQGTTSLPMIKFQCRMLWSLGVQNLNLAFQAVVNVLFAKVRGYFI